MASRILKRRALRRQADQAEQVEPSEGAASDTAVAVAMPKKRKARASTAPKTRKPRAKKAPTRMRARWGIFDGAMKQVAVFDYNQLVAAKERLTVLLANSKGIHFMQIVKEPMPEPAPAEPSVEAAVELLAVT